MTQLKALIDWVPRIALFAAAALVQIVLIAHGA
jgi:hypothetical protein